MKKITYFLLIVLICMTTACGRTESLEIENENKQTTEIQTDSKNEINNEKEETMSTETSDETECVQGSNNSVGISMSILDEINQNVTVGTTGAYMIAVQEAVKMLDWGVGTGLDPQEIKEATIEWLMDKGNDEQIAFSEKLKQVDEAYHKLLSDDAMDLLESAGCENASYPWSDTPVEAIEVVMDAVGLRPYVESSIEIEDWKITFEKSLLENYEVTVDHYEDLGDGVYQVYVVIDGKTVPYVTVDSKTGDYHG